VNTNLAAAFGGLAALLLSYYIERRPSVAHVINGCLAGLVGITACCHVVHPTMSLVIGGAAGIISVLGSYLLERLKIDDAVGAVPVHAFAGAWGTLAVALFGDPALFGTGLTRWQQFLAQLAGVATCFGWAFGVGLVSLLALNRVMRLRVHPKDELQGLNISEHGESTELIDLLHDMREHRQHGEFSQRVHVEPYTEVRRRARRGGSQIPRHLRERL
jgi:Amt family ammonium transporter